MMRDIATAMDGFLRRGDKGQDQAALLAEKRKDRLLQVPAKKKSIPQASAALRGRYDCGG